jgi:hypothetical protein
MTDRELMQQALDALTKSDYYSWRFIAPLIEALRERLAQQADDPYGYFQYDIRLDAWVQNRHSDKGVAFYTSPKPAAWVGLTDDEIQTIVNMVATGTYQTSDTFARAIEAKLKEKNFGMVK